MVSKIPRTLNFPPAVRPRGPVYIIGALAPLGCRVPSFALDWPRIYESNPQKAFNEIPALNQRPRGSIHNLHLEDEVRVCSPCYRHTPAAHLLWQAGSVSSLPNSCRILVHPWGSCPSWYRRQHTRDLSKQNYLVIKLNYESFFRMNPSKSKLVRSLGCWGFYVPILKF